MQETNRTPAVPSRQSNFAILSRPSGVYEFISETDRYDGDEKALRISSATLAHPDECSQARE